MGTVYFEKFGSPQKVARFLSDSNGSPRENTAPAPVKKAVRPVTVRPLVPARFHGVIAHLLGHSPVNRARLRMVPRFRRGTAAWLVRGICGDLRGCCGDLRGYCGDLRGYCGTTAGTLRGSAWDLRGICEDLRDSCGELGATAASSGQLRRPRGNCGAA